MSEKWAEQGTSTYLGVHSQGFPNLFIVTGPQGGGGTFNFIDSIEAHAEYIVWVLTTMRERAVGDHRCRRRAPKRRGSSTVTMPM